jgi:Arf/Sar family protein
MGSVFSNLMSLIISRKLDIVIVGPCNSGKTTLLNVLSEGAPLETVPTVGLDVRIVKRGKLQMKCWDLGGQPQYQYEWARYTRGCDCILFVIDCYNTNMLPDARASLHRLLEDKDLATTPLLIIANKIDLEPHVSETDLIRGR